MKEQEEKREPRRGGKSPGEGWEGRPGCCPNHHSETLIERGLKWATALEGSSAKRGRGRQGAVVWGQEAKVRVCYRPTVSGPPPPPYPHTNPQPQAATQEKCPLPPVGRAGAKSGLEPGQDVAGKIDVTMVASTTPSAAAWSPAPVITAGRKEGRPPGSDAQAPGSLVLPPSLPGGSFLSCLPLRETQGLPDAPGSSPTAAGPSSLPFPRTHLRWPDGPFQPEAVLPPTPPPSI